MFTAIHARQKQPQEKNVKEDERRTTTLSSKQGFLNFFSYQDFAFLVRFHCLVAMEWGKARTWIVEGVVKKGRKRHWLWGKNWWRMSVRARESYYGRIEPLRVPSAFVQCQTKCIFRKNITRNVIFFPPSFLVVSNWVLLYFFLLLFGLLEFLYPHFVRWIVCALHREEWKCARWWATP